MPFREGHVLRKAFSEILLYSFEGRPGNGKFCADGIIFRTLPSIIRGDTNAGYSLTDAQGKEQKVSKQLGVPSGTASRSSQGRVGC